MPPNDRAARNCWKACSTPRSRRRTRPPACPHTCRRRPAGRLIVLAAGKAAGSMAEVAERHYLDRLRPPERLAGIAVTRHGYGRPTRPIAMIEAGHPVPDAAGLAAAERVLRSPMRRAPTIWCWCCCPAAPRPTGSRRRPACRFADKQALTRALLRSGANIGEINTVRKHLSRIKGGRLARARASGARGHARDLRRARRRSGGDRIGSDRARSDHARRRARDRRALSGSTLPAGGRARARRSGQRDAEARRSGLRSSASSSWSHDRPTRSAPPRRRCAPPATNASCSATASRARRATVAAEHARIALALQTARPARRDPVRRRADGDLARQGPRRPEPGIRAGAGDRARGRAGHRGARRRHRRHRRRRRRGQRPGGRLHRRDHAGPRARRLASIRPRFSPTTIRPDFSTSSAIWSTTGPTCTNVNDFRAIVVDRP